ncbi:hypothetical protein DT594_17795 [Halopseudomonas laoshanensis]|uniref:Toxin VasX N-terminal region domain-containing protein n=2 Tax=Halopseudomonas laoshanensis TaxID=2268758 RepID=A0A7V7KUS7_9GAMM|nr:hypothetical protein DT594_17795 [Halopseudomonas laoshanensis]
MGVRQLRDGFLYVIEEQTGYLHEYEIAGGNLNKLLWQGAEVSSNTRTTSVGPAKLVFPRRSTLHVAYSEVQWTAAKCSQVLGSGEERRHFMQQVNPGSANPATGGTHLMTWLQTERWLAEVAENHQEVEPPELPEGADPDENLPYLWETPSLFKETSIDALKGQVLADYKDDSLCLVIRDDIGVMRDLANFQDNVVGWIDDWAEGGEQPAANERDYMLACYIESLSLMTPQALDQIGEFAEQPDIQALFEDLEKLPEPQQGQTRQSLIDWLNVGSNQGHLPRIDDSSLPTELRRRIDAIYSQLNSSNGIRIVAQAEAAVEDYYFNQCMANADPAFVERHRPAIIRVKRDHNKRVKGILTGVDLGQRGINDLIDRPAMDAALKRDRANLKRWNELLDAITADRLQMVTNNRFHLAAWYYDSTEAQQIGLAFSAQYGCLKDICRSDHAVEAIHDWLEQQPDHDRPLFFTLPLAAQIDLSAKLATLNDAAYKLVTLTPEWVNRLRDIERPFLPALDELPESSRVLGQSAHQALSPALAHGFSRALSQALQATRLDQIPSMEELFSGLSTPNVRRMFDAARIEGVTFTVGDVDDLAALRQEISDVFEAQAEQTRLRKRHSNAKTNSGHKSPAAQQALAEFQEARNLHRAAENRLFERLSPISRVSDSGIRLSAASAAYPGLSLVFPDAQHRVATGMWRNVKMGYLQAPAVGMLGDGAGLLIAIVQAVNLVNVLRETVAQNANTRDWSDFTEALFATAASGFMAVQAITDTALKARSTSLLSSLKNYAVKDVHVLMGKLHVRLGLAGYGAMFVVALYSAGQHRANWTAAVRSGNSAAQNGAITAMIGAVGMAGASGYGLVHTTHAGISVFRGSSWAVAGPRLSTVFFRVNLAGALFTVLELGGTWWYNRHNLSHHDAWLHATPWSRDADKRGNLSLTDYQDQLQSILHVPVAELRHTRQGNWISGMLGAYQGVEVDIQLPGLSRSALLAPVGTPAPVQLSLAGYQIRKEGRRNVERWQPISEDLNVNTEMNSTGPLQLRISSPAFPESSAKLDLLLVLSIETLDSEGRYKSQEHSIRLRTQSEGLYPATEQHISGAPAPRIILDPHFLTQQASNDQA